MYLAAIGFETELHVPDAPARGHEACAGRETIVNRALVRGQHRVAESLAAPMEHARNVQRGIADGDVAPVDDAGHGLCRFVDEDVFGRQIIVHQGRRQRGPRFGDAGFQVRVPRFKRGVRRDRVEQLEVLERLRPDFLDERFDRLAAPPRGGPPRRPGTRAARTGSGRASAPERKTPRARDPSRCRALRPAWDSPRSVAETRVRARRATRRPVSEAVRGRRAQAESAFR